MDNLTSLPLLCKTHAHNPNVVFKVRMSKEETCFEQISVISFTSLENTLNSFVLVCTLKLTCVTTYLSKFRFNKSCPIFKHLMCLWKRQNTLFFGGQNMKEYFQ